MINNFKTVIDVNADVGEGLNNEAQLMPFLSSCNIACGGHAGNESTMASVVELAKQHQVKIGAHPSFPDKENFGRVQMAISHEDLLTSLKAQVNDLIEILKFQGESLHHIKPHGALYNLANTDKAFAEVVILLMKHYDKTAKLYAPYGSVIAKMAEDNGIAIVHEVFADRNYNDDLTLIPRSEPNALIHDGFELSAHVLYMLQHHKVKTINGAEVNIDADTVCIHGDHPQAEQHLKILTSQLNKNGINIK